MDIASSEKVCVGEGRDRMTLNHTNFTFTHKVPTMSVGILHICNLWILLKKIVMSAENFIFIHFFAVKVDGSDINPGICM